MRIASAGRALSLLLLVSLAACGTSQPSLIVPARAPSASAPERPLSPEAAAVVARSAFAAIARGEGRRFFGDALLLGPAMTTSVYDDLALADIGVHMTLPYESGDQVYEYTTWGFLGPDIDVLLSSGEFRRIAAFLASGRVRPATAPELQQTYLITSPGMGGLAIPVVEQSDRRVAVIVSNDGRILWMEVLSMWGTAAQKAF